MACLWEETVRHRRRGRRRRAAGTHNRKKEDRTRSQKRGVDSEKDPGLILSSWTVVIWGWDRTWCVSLQSGLAWAWAWARRCRARHGSRLAHGHEMLRRANSAQYAYPEEHPARSNNCQSVLRCFPGGCPQCTHGRRTTGVPAGKIAAVTPALHFVGGFTRKSRGECSQCIRRPICGDEGRNPRRASAYAYHLCPSVDLTRGERYDNPLCCVLCGQQQRDKQQHLPTMHAPNRRPRPTNDNRLQQASNSHRARCYRDHSPSCVVRRASTAPASESQPLSSSIISESIAQ
ncbi:hypothetical protein K466DRAFT_224112 [Polyporus arcularius HHB13444]|uniref:Uncharacterized protein n=1 Tax=Polyporus arcularius HHB13444 TaxID=1314778 RepID=A0A5C3P6I2_9APHY|nr:hypothetical protein K466DRAFT_224112 [Polyporus arcularius HHB13444]